MRFVNLHPGIYLKKLSKEKKLMVLLFLARSFFDTEYMLEIPVVNIFFSSCLPDWECPVCKRPVRTVVKYGKRYSCISCRGIKKHTPMDRNNLNREKAPLNVLSVDIKRWKKIQKELNGRPIPKYLLPTYVAFLNSHARVLDKFFKIDPAKIAYLENLIK